MDNVKEFLSRTLQASGNIFESFVKFIEFYLNEVNKLGFESEPDYAKIHTKITDTLASLGHSESTKDNFYVFSPAAPAPAHKNTVKGNKQVPLELDVDDGFDFSDRAVAKRQLENETSSYSAASQKPRKKKAG